MGSKERISRLKDKQLHDIITAAVEMVRLDGRQALSLRKIAEKIEYTVPVIYIHFENKEALLVSVARTAYRQLNAEIRDTTVQISDPSARLVAVLKTYRAFALRETELYQLMCEQGFNCADPSGTFPELSLLVSTIKEPLSTLFPSPLLSHDLLLVKCRVLLSITHGLISADLFWKQLDGENALSQRKLFSGILEALIVE